MGVDAVYDDVYAEVRQLLAIHTDYDVKVTGHSMGAAMAQITGSYLITDAIDVSMINFGQPRTGDPKYADWAN